jgi:hypothetical protein
VKLPKLSGVARKTQSDRQSLLKGVCSFIRQYRQLRQVKGQLLSLPVKLKSGRWHIDGGLLWQNAEDKKRVEKLFFSFYRPNPLRAGSWRTRLAKLAFRVLTITLFRIKNGLTKGPSVVFKSRGGALKLFDFDNVAVITLISGETADRLIHARKLSIFEFFATNVFTIDQSLRASRNLCVKHEGLIDVPCMAMLSVPMQRQTMKKMCSTYVAYAQRHAMAAAPSLFEDCFDEVTSDLSQEAQAQCLKMKDKYLEFVRTALTLPAHLDFNVANVIDNGDLLLLDIEDAGLRLPVTYDMNNLLLNEAYQDRSTHLLMAVLRNPEGAGYSDLLQTAQVTTNQFRVSLFVNYILYESRYVSVKLSKPWGSGQAQNHWDNLVRNVPGWPFIETKQRPEALCDCAFNHPDHDNARRAFTPESHLLNKTA